MAGHKDAYAISGDGGRPRPATDGEAGWTAASRDGRWIYFESSRSGESQIWKIPVSGGSAGQVTKRGGSKPVMSPDGRFLYYFKSLDVWHDGLWKVPVDGGDEIQVAESASGGDGWNNFAAGERGIYFSSSDDPQTVLFLDFSTNKIERIAKLGGEPTGSFSLSPDGRYLLYTLYEPSSGGADLMLVENFR